VQEQVGGAGASRVTAAFELMNWGTAENPRHDLGTDLFVMARDERRFDLGLVVGVQVKTGSTYFRHPRRRNKVVTGWWFRDDDRSHVDAWLSHALPHLIVLHDLANDVSYWAHVTQDAVESTGKGAKIFVPKENTLDTAHRDALLRVAATTRSGLALEGSIWTGIASLLPKDLLRHALTVPRLVAPHPNAGYADPVTPEQAVALLMQGRLAEFSQFADKHPEVPVLDEATRSPDWRWRFAGALGHRLMTGELDKLQALAGEDAPGEAEHIAATVTLAAEFVEAGLVDQALLLLEAELERDEADPVDHAWLRLHHARACVELGKADEARDDAALVQRLRITHPGDITATAIAGVAAMIVFSTSPWANRDVGAVIQGADTAVAWWRAQAVSGALSSFADRTFEDWAEDTTVRLGGGDPVNDQLLTTSLAASYLGDHGAWRHLHELLGQDKLVRLGRSSDPAEARDGLGQLRLAGGANSVKLAVRRLVADGPATAITLAAADIDLDSSTRTTGPADLALLQHGGDLLESEAAERATRWLLAALDDPSAFVSRTTPSYFVGLRLIDTLAGVTPAVPQMARDLVTEYLALMPAQPDQAFATSWARVAAALPADTWSEEVIRRFAARGTGDHPALGTLIRGLAARHDPDVMAGLLSEARTGSLEVLSKLDSVRPLPGDVVASAVAQLSRMADEQVAEARAGHYGYGGIDVGRALAVLNIWHPGHASWEPVYTLLSDPAVAVAQKRGAMHVLASLAERIPDDVRARLAPIARSAAAASAQATTLWFEPNQSTRGVAAHLAAALGAYDAEATCEQLVKLLAGTHDDRLWAVGIASRARQPEHLGLLVGLCQAPDPDLRANAAASLASAVAAGDGGALAIAGLRQCLADPGTRVPQMVATALTAAPSLVPAAQEALTALHDHPSALVRSTSRRSTPDTGY